MCFTSSLPLFFLLSLHLSVHPQGRITVTGLLDREKGDLYTLTVVADDGGPKKDSTVVRQLLISFNLSFFSLFLLYIFIPCCQRWAVFLLYVFKIHM